jgi:hypothetical protein
MSNVRTWLFAAAASAALAGSAYADHPQWTPPQQAFDACAKSAANDPCSFKGRHGNDRHGVCVVPAAGATPGKALVCRAQHVQHEPPPAP